MFLAKTNQKKTVNIYKLRVNEIDWNIYHDQCSQRMGKYYLIDEGCSQSDLKYIF